MFCTDSKSTLQLSVNSVSVSEGNNTMWTQPSQIKFYGYIIINNSDRRNYDPQYVTYTKGMSSVAMNISHYSHTGCKRTVTASSTVTVDDPAVIESVRFENTNTNYTCETPGVVVSISRYYNNGKGNANLQIRDDNGTWRTLRTVSSSSVNTISYTTIAQYVSLGNPIRFRTEKTLLDNNISYSSSTNYLYYLPQFRFPAGKTVLVDPPSCMDGNTTIRVPYERNDNYTLTISGPYPSSHLVNVETNNPTVVKENGYYVFKGDFDEGEHQLTVEYKLSGCDNCSPCAFVDNFTVVKPPSLTIGSSSYEYNGLDNAGNAVQITKRGDMGRVSFQVSGSQERAIIIHAGMYINSTQLSESYQEQGSTYYRGTAYIDLPAGTYTVWATNSSCISNTVENLFLNEPSAMNFTVTSDSPSCNEANLINGNCNDGQIHISAFSGGIGNYTYQIDNGTPVNVQNDIVSVTGQGVGAYTVTVSDSYENSFTKPITVTAPSPIVVSVSGTTAPTMACSSDGTVTLSVSGGTPPYTYGKMQISMDVNPTLTGLLNGSHTVYVQDAANCMVEAIVNVPGSPASLNVVSQTFTVPTCNGDEDGRCILEIGNVQGILSVSADVPADSVTVQGNTITIVGLSSGSHVCTINDTKNDVICSMDIRYTVPEKEAVHINTVITPASDQGRSDGQITVNLSGGNGAPFRVYFFDGDSNIQFDEGSGTDSYTFSNLAGAAANGGKLYRITAYDSEDCSSTAEVRVLEPAPLQLDASVARLVSCPGGNDAIINLSAWGGWGDYRYSQDSIVWDTNTYYPNLSAGTYVFYVKDQYNAVSSDTVSITDPAPLTIVIDDISPVLCHGSATGWIRFRISGGMYPYTLVPSRGKITESIADGDTLFTVSELPAGIYTVSVRDSRNCTAVALPETITEPAQLNVTVSGLVQPTCGWNNGSLSAQTTGGIAPYTYVINATDAGFIQTKISYEAVIFDDIPGGSYRISVTDNAGCFAQSAVVTFNLYVSPSVESCLVSDSQCAGGNSGRVEVTPVAGSSHIASYMIYNADSTFTDSNSTGIFENLRSGNYRIVVYDGNGCRSQLPYPVTIREPEAMSIVIEAMVPPTGKGSKDGKIFFRVQGGNAGRLVARLLDAEMSPVNEILAINNAPLSFSVYGGNYYLEVSDEKGCSIISDLIPVMEPEEELYLIVKEVKDALCKSQTGSIEVEGAGGWGGYRYRRAVEEQYSSLNRFENLYPGSYVITVTDRMGATYNETIVVNEPQDSLKAEIIHWVPLACGNNGPVSIRLSGGTPPYRLYETNDTIFCSEPQVVEWMGTGSGAFLLHLLDANGCRFELEAEPPKINQLHINGFELIYPRTSGASNGAIYALVEGGKEPYSYSWTSLLGSVTNSPTNDAEIYDIPAGYYLFEVSDAEGCSAQETVCLYDPDDLYFTVLETGDETDFQASNGYAVLEATADIEIYTIITPSLNILTCQAGYNTSQFRTENRTVYLQNLESGTWFVTGTTASGQQVVAGFTIKPFPNFNFGRMEVTNTSAPGASDGEIRLEVHGGGGENTFVWTDGAGNTYYSINDEYGSVISNISAGKYTIEVTDRYGNRIVQIIEVLEPAQALQLNLVEQQNQSCKDSRDAYVVLEAAGGWGDYQFRHESDTYFNNASSFSGLATGEHTFYVIDKRGTVASLPIRITEPEYLRAAVVKVDSVKCKGNYDGRILFAVTGGTAPYSFKELGRDFWQAGNEAQNLSAGLHTFIFTDSNNCKGQDTLTVYVPEPDSLLFRNISVTHTTCGEDNGRISVEMQGGTQPYYYRWLDYNNQVIGNESSITDLKQNGLYRLEVTDANGCTQQTEQLIQPSSLPRILKVETTDVLCYGESNGTARVTTAEAGQPYSPYTLTWSNGDTGEYSGRFPQGQHSVTIADENGCSSIYYFDIGQPDSLRIRFVDVLEPHCYGNTDAYIHTETLGGVGGYTYLWNTDATTPDLDNIPKGDYWVRVTDANGCSYTRSITLNEPPYLSVDLGEDVRMCPGNTYVMDGGEYVAHRWFTEKGDVGSGRYLYVSEEGHYFLEATTPDGCPAWGDMTVSIGENALIADMLLVSEAMVGDTLVLFELSNLALDSLQWEYDREAFERITPQNEYAGLPYVLQLRCGKTGIYNIGLCGYSGGCISSVVKQVEVLPESDRSPDDWYTILPMITSLKQYPNPSRGQFTVELELREPAEARFLIFDVASGVCRDQRTESDSDIYRIEYNLQNLDPGVYVLMVTVGNERKQIKLIIE
ncbi:MAG: T9SS type A sorting domain-containing protein [Dysgonamonadaceae bacterium]|nr:T9SS type A sorting domain-containing protein [Dysgonamonadaceae bacterium]